MTMVKIGSEELPMSTDLDSRVEVEKKPSIKDRVGGVVEKIKERQRVNKALEPERRKERIEKMKLDIEEQKAKNEYNELRKKAPQTGFMSALSGLGTSVMGSKPTTTTKRSKPVKPMNLSDITNFKIDGLFGSQPKRKANSRRPDLTMSPMDFKINLPKYGMTSMRSVNIPDRKMKAKNMVDFKLKLPKFKM